MLEGGKGQPRALEEGGELAPGREQLNVLIKSLPSLVFLNYPSFLPPSSSESSTGKLQGSFKAGCK